jgi:succinyl-CoA synthetase beta subunit
LKLFEHEAKQVLASYGVLTPIGKLASKPQQAREAAQQIGLPVAIKAQVLVAGRGKSGGILFAHTPQQVEEAAQKLLGANIKGYVVKQVLVEKKLDIRKELYFAVTVDRLNRSYVVVASKLGGVNIEEVAQTSPQEMVKTAINPQLGFRTFHARQIASQLGYSGNQMLELADILEKIAQISAELDAELVEANPLVETVDGKFFAADARIILDDNALFRHPEYAQKKLEAERELGAVEAEAAKVGLEYVKLDGDIGIIGNGAGLVMATLDVASLFGGKPANFLDLGGGASTERIVKALELVQGDAQVRVVFVNVLGGMTRCDEVAQAIVEVQRKSHISKPVVVRLVGTYEEEGKRILRSAGLHVFDSMEEAAEKAVALTKEA